MTILPLTGGGDVFARSCVPRLRGGVSCRCWPTGTSPTGRVEVDLCGHPARMAAGPAALALATGAALFPVTIHYERLPAGAWRLAHRHPLPRARCPPPDTGTTRAGRRDDPGRAPTPSPPRSGAHPRTGTCCSGSSCRPGGRREDRASSARTPSTSPGGCSSTSATWPRPPRPGSRRQRPRARRRRHPAARGTSSAAGAPCPSVQRLGRPAGLRPGHRGAGRPLGRGGDFDVRAPARAGDARAVACSRCGPRRARSWRPSTRPTCAPGRCRRHTRSCGPAWRRSAAGSRSPRTPGAPSHHLGGDAVVIPNGVYVDPVRPGVPRPEWQGTARADRRSRSSAGSTSRARGCPCWRGAMPAVLARRPRHAAARRRPGDVAAARERLRPRRCGAHEFLGPVSDDDKAALLRSVGPLRRPAHRAARASASCWSRR